MTLTMGGMSVVPILLAVAIEAWGWRIACWPPQRS